MAEKGGTEILGIFTICIILFSIGLSGCIGDEETNNTNRCVNFHIENIVIEAKDFDMNTVLEN